MLRVSIFVELRHAERRGSGDGLRRRAGARRRDLTALYRRDDARLRRGLARRGIPVRQSSREPHLRMRIVVQRVSTSPLTPLPSGEGDQSRKAKAASSGRPFSFRRALLNRTYDALGTDLLAVAGAATVYATAGEAWTRCDACTTG